jgi:hypothetical protein
MATLAQGGGAGGNGMSKTPRTDDANAKLLRHLPWPHQAEKFVEFARQIERECAEAREYIRARPPIQCEDYGIEDHETDCRCNECRLWRKAAGLEDAKGDRHE